MSPAKILLIILDGYGIGPTSEHNAIFQASTPFLDHVIATCPHTQLTASGDAVGALPGQIGTSEVGHLTIGAGRVVTQDIARIHSAINHGDFFENKAFKNAIAHAQKNQSTLHLAGLVSPGGVHSHSDHLLALLQLVAAHKLPRVKIHAFLDGRDTAPFSGREYVRELEQHARAIHPNYRIATISGRFYAMDRNENWERTTASMRAIIDGAGERTPDTNTAIQSSYDQKISDEFIVPHIVEGATPVQSDDAIIFFNFRSDRMRQMVALFLNERPEIYQHALRNLSITTMTAYTDNPHGVSVAFPDELVRDHLTEVISAHGRRQLKVTETEKYAHLSYFFNGGREEAYPGEDRIMIPSPRVRHFEETPQMSAPAITDAIISKLHEGVYDFIATNYCNADMLGHTGDINAAIAGVQYIDGELSRLIPAARAAGYEITITADHGNAEEMYIPDLQSKHTAHTLHPVPYIYVGAQATRLPIDGTLADVAPHILSLMGLDIPAQMLDNDEH